MNTLDRDEARNMLVALLIEFNTKNYLRWDTDWFHTITVEEALSSPIEKWIKVLCEPAPVRGLEGTWELAPGLRHTLRRWEERYHEVRMVEAL